MFTALPQTAHSFFTWTWPQIEAYYDDLENRPLTEDTLDDWMRDWGQLGKLVDEGYWRLWVATTLDTTDAEADRRFLDFLTTIQEPAQIAEQRLRRKLLASGLTPHNYDAPLRNIQAEADLFREANLPLLTEEQRLGNEYDRLRGAQTVSWEGEEATLVALSAVVAGHPDRAWRERAWRLSMERFLADREAFNHLWAELIGLRQRIADNANLPNYRAFRWQQMLRLDYTPEDCETFHDSVEEVVVPAVERLNARRCRLMGIDRVRPWDVECDPLGRPPLRPFQTVDELETKAEALFYRLDTGLGDQFALLRHEGLLDLDNRPGKMPSSYCATFAVQRRPFVFMNVVGLAEDVTTLLHECGHAFHTFGSVEHYHHDQLRIGTEFHEVASVTMELLGLPYLDAFYTPQEAARARADHLEMMLRFWPYIAVVDAFQHWAHTHADEARDPAACDAQWAALWRRFMPGEDWSGFEDALVTGWHRKLHIFRAPFYYIDYGLAQLGAAQIWEAAQTDPAGALARYKAALELGGTARLPDLFTAAGAQLAFDAPTLRRAVDGMMRAIQESE
jgi:oligoendopeptidase F